MSHIHTVPGQYDLTASAYIVYTGGRAPALLLHRHRKLNKYLQFGGHVELDESPWSAVAHEITEESGYSMSRLDLLQPGIPAATISEGIMHPQPVTTISVRFGDTDHYHTDIAYAFTAKDMPPGSADRSESAEIKAFTMPELIALPTEDIPEDVREIGVFILQECLASWTNVPSVSFLTENPR
ncbi:MAG TPA: NUDIX domain-containing protein [Candidatus Saccharimonadales bacterium]|nr:NUDIX domain-containing protein [Candidatus Saccharimonadales bacterium]